MKTTSASAGGSPSISSASALLVAGDVVDRLADGRDLLRILVRDLDPELILELHDQLDEVERVGVEILLKGRFVGDLILFDAELLGQDILDLLGDFLARCCHVTSLSWGAGKRADHTGSDWTDNLVASLPTTSCSTPRAARRIAFAIAVADELPCAITTSPFRPRRYAPPYVSGSSRERSLRAAGRMSRPPSFVVADASISARRPVRMDRIEPSSVFSATLPVNPSVTMT